MKTPGQRSRKLTQKAAPHSFYGLFDISAGGSYDYENQMTEQNISENVESQRVAKAFQDADETEVSIYMH